MTFYPERWPNTNSDSSLVSPRHWERPDTYFTSNFSWTMARFERVQAFSDRTIADCANSQQSVAFPPLFYTCSWFASVLSVECLSLSLFLSRFLLFAPIVFTALCPNWFVKGAATRRLEPSVCRGSGRPPSNTIPVYACIYSLCLSIHVFPSCTIGLRRTRSIAQSGLQNRASLLPLPFTRNLCVALPFYIFLFLHALPWGFEFSRWAWASNMWARNHHQQRSSTVLHDSQWYIPNSMVSSIYDTQNCVYM